MQKVAVYGAGGHGDVVMEAILECIDHGQKIEIVGWLDDGHEPGEGPYGYPILGGKNKLESLKNEGVSVVIAIGANHIRKKIADELERLGVKAFTVQHPLSYVSRTAEIAEGTMIITGAVIHPHAKIGRHTIINTTAVIEHDNVIGSFTHIAPGVHLGGRVKVGDSSEVFTGASVKPDVIIGNNCIVGLQAAVIRDVPDGTIVVGNPAKPLVKN